MKDKEKQIEEMTKDKQWQRRDKYCLRIQKALQYKGTGDNEDVPSILVDFENEIRKEMLPKDSVVLSKEEYAHLLKSNINDVSEYIADELNEASKETAEKFYDKVMSFIGSNQKFWIVDGEHITIIQVDKLFDFVMETAKQLGVEIKE